MKKHKQNVRSTSFRAAAGTVAVLAVSLACFAFTSAPQNDGEPEFVPWITPASANTVKNPFKADDAAALAEGKTLYHNTCEQCHGLEGKGDGIQMVTLSKKIADLSSPMQ